MNDLWLNGRPAEPWEAFIAGQGHRDARERDLLVLSGLLAEYPRVPRPEEPRRRLADVDPGDWLAS